MNYCKFKLKSPAIVVLLLLLFISLIINGCGFPSASDDNSSLQETTMALVLQVTIAAMENQQAANQVDNNAQMTQVAQAVQATLDAVQPPPTQEPPAESPPTPTPEAVVEEQEPSVPSGGKQISEDFENWMKSAKILLYEDIAGVYTTTRFVQQALDGMGLNYVDVKDAVGLFKEQMISGGPGGAGWDLIISAKEARGHVRGEMYVYMNDALNDGSSVIIEEYELDSIVNGKISTIISRCGVEFQDQWAWDPLNEQLLWPVEGTHPIHHQPHEGIALTNPSGFWPQEEIGDFLRLNAGSSAVPLWSARVNAGNTFLTAVSCLDNQLILQTYSTHNYGKDRVVLMWENYIYNALLARYENLK